MKVNYFCGWLENWRVMLISTKIVVEVEVEIGKNEFDQAYLWGFCCSFSIYLYLYIIQRVSHPPLGCF